LYGSLLRVIRYEHRTSLQMDMGHRTGPRRNCSAMFTMTGRCSWWRLRSIELSLRRHGGELPW